MVRDRSMSWLPSFEPARVLATMRLVRRGAFVTTLAVTERLLIPATAWTLFGRTTSTKIIAALVLGAVFTLRAFVQRVFTSRAEADLFARVVASLLHGDVLRESVLPDEDARAELAQGVYHASRQLAQELPVLIADVVASAALAVVVVATEPVRLVLLAGGLTLGVAVALAWSTRRIHKAVSSAWELQGRVLEHMVDALEGRLELVALGMRPAFLAESRARADAWGDAGVRVAAALLSSGRLPALAIGAIVAIGVVIRASSSESFAASFADAAFLASMTPAFAGVAQGLQAAARAERWVRVVARVVQEERPLSGGTLPAPAPPASIAFERVSFRYEGAPDAGDALRDLDFTMDRERIVALVGANGSGKSTCLRLLLGLARPRSGTIRIAGVDLRTLDADSWRSQVAFLPQRAYFPQRADVRRAVHLMAPQASDERILAALDRVGLLHTMGSGAPLEMRVDTLSVGQRQRLALARFLCRDASLLILDEPDANLDREGVARVAELLRELGRGHVVIFSAHTDDLVRVADRVIALHAGSIIRDQSFAQRTAGAR
jgi:ABC-type bacteriocin/lantibiotic exporter with double-glycine peptidase domain